MKPIKIVQLFLLLLFFALTIYSSQASTFVVNTLSDSGPGSLREAINLANADASATTVSPHIIDASGITGTINILTALPGLARHITFQGPSVGELIIRRNAVANFRIFYINPGFKITLNYLTIANGKDGGGGGIYNAGSNLIVDHCTFTENGTSTGDGGAIGNYNSGILTVSNTLFHNNSSSGSGAAIASPNGGIISISNCTITNNTAFYSGSAVSASASTTTITNSTVLKNTCTDGSGSIHHNGTSLTISGSLIKGNSGPNGGGIYLMGGTGTITSSTIDSNKTTNTAGGITIMSGSMTISSSTISRNTSFNGAGGLDVSSSCNLALTNSTVSYNQTTNGPGGITNRGNLSLINCTITKNSSSGSNPGGLDYFSGVTTQLSNTIVIGNTSTPSLNLLDIRGGSTSNSISSLYGHNIIGVTNSVTYTGNTSYNITGVAPATVLSSALANNGGSTLTHALVPCSYAINAGAKTGAPATDQTGTLRPASDSIDIGALESASGSGRVFITAHPANVNACTSGTSFSVSVPGKDISYQWQVNTGSGFTNISDGGVYSNSTTSKLLISSITGMNGYQYRCVVSGPCATLLTSNFAILNVNTMPVVTTQPTDKNACAGTYPSFPLVASGALTYQWQVDDGSGFATIPSSTLYSGVTTPSLQVNEPGSGLDGFKYRCVIGNTCGTISSASATLTVSTTPSVSTQPFNQNTCPGGMVSFGISTMGSGSSYQWQVNTGSGFANISNGGVYSNATTEVLTVTGVTSSMNGYIYKCLINNPCSNIQSTNATLTVNSGLTFTAQPTNEVICPNGNANFTVAATGALGYQWQVNTGSGFTNIHNEGVYSNANTATLTITGATLSMAGYQYRCNIGSDVCPSREPSESATLTFVANPAIYKHPADHQICPGGNITLTMDALFTSSFHWQVNTGSGFTDITNGTLYTNANTLALRINGATAAMDGYQYRGVANNACGVTQTTSVATITMNTSVTVSSHPAPATICSGTNATFTVAASGGSLSYQWQVNTGSGFTNISNGSAYSNVTTNTLTVISATNTKNGYQYRCVVALSGCGGNNATSDAATLSIKDLPTITTQPVAQSVCSGSNATFSVIAEGNVAGYLWEINTTGTWASLTDSDIYSGVTTPTLTITGATVNAYYRCSISNSCTATKVNTNGVALQVSSVITINSQPSNKSTCVGNNTVFTIGATGSGLTYQWQVNTGTGFANITNGGVYSNATTATLTLIGVTAGMDNYQYACIISSNCGTSATSGSAFLTVSGLATTITSQPENKIGYVNEDLSFSVETSGGSLTYQWQENTGSGFSDLSDDASYSGSTTSILTISNVTASMDQNQYRCQITSSNCAMPVTSTIAKLVILDPTICMVTYDQASGKNMVIFEKPSDLSSINSFIIYKEGNVAGQFAEVGRLAKNDLSTFTDNSSNPAQQANIYTIAVEDTSETISPLSDPHKTMHLTINKGANNTTWNLIWTPYQGMNVATYNIYRGLSATTMTFLGSTSGSFTSYSDLSAPVASNIYYQIEIVGPTCNPTARLASVNVSRSNIAETQLVTGIHDQTLESTVKIYPNPAKETLFIEGLQGASEVKLYTITGSFVSTHKVNGINSQIIMPGIASGMYMIEIKTGDSQIRKILTIE